MSKRDVVVIGAGPAGSSAAILLAQSGWQVSLVEQHRYPRRKVCGECIAAGNLALLDELGVGPELRQLGGSDLERVGWMRAETVVVAPMPPAANGGAGYGYALGRDELDAGLLARARAVGVRIVQPARVRRVCGMPGDFHCEIERLDGAHRERSSAGLEALRASLVIDAHGAWEAGPKLEGDAMRRTPPRASDLFAFKATFARSALAPGWLPVLAVEGGYGGLVVAGKGRTTVALCLRRDALRALRAKHPAASAGAAVEAHLIKSCRGVREALEEASREGPWLSVGPLRPGARLNSRAGIFRVGNAAGEIHPLIGEGISMALQSSKLLSQSLLRHLDARLDAHTLRVAQRAYASAWHRAFRPRMGLAALYAHLVMRAPLAATLDAALRHWPTLLTAAARCAGKARTAVHLPIGLEEPT